MSSILKRQGVPTRWRRLTKADIDKAEYLYVQGWSSARIANLLEVDPETVRLRLRGVQMRDPHQRGWARPYL